MRVCLKTSDNVETTQQQTRRSTPPQPIGTQALTTEHPLLRMQRLYGNRYVQRVLSLVKKADKDAEATPDVERAIQQSRGGGRALDSGGTRAQMEPAFGADFSGVRGHTDTESDALNRSLNTRAFTTGQNIFFRQEAYNTGSSGGRELLAHELTHVVQQASGARPKLAIGQPGDTYEREAEEATRTVIQKEPKLKPKTSEQGNVRRQSEEEEEEPLQAKDEAGLMQRHEEEEEGLVQAKSVNARRQRSTTEGPSILQLKSPDTGAKGGALEASEERLVQDLITAGKTNENTLTNELFFYRHPEVDRKAKLKPGSPGAREWIDIRNNIVQPALKSPVSPAKMPATPDKKSVTPLYATILLPLGRRLKKLLSTVGSSIKFLFGLSSPKEETNPTKANAENEVKNTLKVALDLEKDLRKRHPDYAKKGGFQGYGTGKDQYVCTTFAAEVLKRAGYKITGKVDKKININIDWKKETGAKKPSKEQKQEALAKLLEADDPRIKGVVNALVSSGQGVEITPEQLQPADFVQYWYKSKKDIGGHVVQVVKVLSPGKKIRAHGSHGSKRGVATITVYLTSKKMMKVYCVRPT